MASMNFEVGTEPRSEPVTAPAVGKRTEEVDEFRLESRKNRYNPGVLVGTWFDRRAEHVPVPNDWITVYDSTYLCLPVLEHRKRGHRAYEQNKSKGEGLGHEFLIEHYKDAYYNNYATTYDLLYRVVPLGLCGPRRRKYNSGKDLWVPELDLSKNYGNITNYGLVEAFKCDSYMTSLPEPRTSIHRTSYTKPTATDFQRFPRPVGSFNEPNLSHLDIDPNQPFRPHLKRSCMPKRK